MILRPGRLLNLLLVTSYLVLAVGSVWHVHDHHGHLDHHGQAPETCPWCLAAVSVLVLAVVFLWPGISGLVAGFLPRRHAAPLLFSCLEPWASRAPPAS